MFEVSKHLIRVKGGREYLPVAWRLVWFRSEKPTWGIKTVPVSIDVEKGIAVFHATVTDEAGRTVAEGTKMETARGFADFVEKAETGSVGRALGVLGYGTQFAPEFDEGERIVDTPQLPNGSGRRPAQAEPIPLIRKCSECRAIATPTQAAESQVRHGRVLCGKHLLSASAAR